MRERIKRRKPKTESQSQQPTDESQAPLQPAYFDTAPSTDDAVPRDSDEVAPASSSEEAIPVAETTASEPNTAPSGQTPAGGPVRRRRRRGRGGRGRGKDFAQPAAQIQSAQAEPSSPEPVAAPIATASTPSTSRTSKGAVILAVGLPGSGKSSWFKRHKITPLSSDLLRALLFDDPKEQRFQDLVFSNLRSMLKARLIARRPMNYVDATNLSPHERHTWMKMAKDYGYDVHAVYFDVPVDVCIERNQRRERNVPEDVMRRMASKLRPPTFEEGFTKITVVRVKKKEGQGDEGNLKPEVSEELESD